MANELNESLNKLLSDQSNAQNGTEFSLTLNSKMGMVVNVDGTVSAVFENGQAFSAGVVVGCKIIKADGVSVSSLDDLKTVLRACTDKEQDSCTLAYINPRLVSSLTAQIALLKSKISSIKAVEASKVAKLAEEKACALQMAFKEKKIADEKAAVERRILLEEKKLADDRAEKHKRAALQEKKIAEEKAAHEKAQALHKVMNEKKMVEEKVSEERKIAVKQRTLEEKAIQAKVIDGEISIHIQDKKQIGNINIQPVDFVSQVSEDRSKQEEEEEAESLTEESESQSMDGTEFLRDFMQRGGEPAPMLSPSSSNFSLCFELAATEVEVETVKHGTTFSLDLTHDTGMTINEKGIVNTVVANSQADAAGVHVGCVVVQVDGKEIKSLAELNAALVHSKTAGSSSCLVRYLDPERIELVATKADVLKDQFVELEALEMAKAKKCAENIAAQKKAEEEAKIASQKKAEEEAKMAAQKKAEEEAKIASQKKAEEEAKIAAQKKTEEEAKIAAQKKAEEEAKIAAQKKAEEETKIASPKKAEEEAQKKAEKEAKMAAQKKAEEEAKIAAQKKAEEEAKIAAQKKAEEEAKMAAQKKAIEGLTELEKDQFVALEQERFRKEDSDRHKATMKIQNLSRQREAKRKAEAIRKQKEDSDRHQATMKIQNLSRQREAKRKAEEIQKQKEEQEEKKTEAAVKMQKFNRKREAKRKAEAIRKVKVEKEKNRAAMRMQCLMRKKDAMRHAEKIRLELELRKQELAALKLQTFSRNRFVNEKRRESVAFRTDSEKQRREDAIIKLQSLSRQRESHKIMQQLRKEREAKIREFSILKMQGFGRQTVFKRRAQEIRDKKMLREKAALVIQGRFRCYQAMRRVCRIVSKLEMRRLRRADALRASLLEEMKLQERIKKREEKEAKSLARKEALEAIEVVDTMDMELLVKNASLLQLSSDLRADLRFTLGLTKLKGGFPDLINKLFFMSLFNNSDPSPHNLAARLQPLSRMRISSSRNRRSTKHSPVPLIDEIVDKFASSVYFEKAALSPQDPSMTTTSMVTSTSASTHVNFDDFGDGTTASVDDEDVNEREEETPQLEKGASCGEEEDLSAKLDRRLLEQHLKLQERVSALMTELTEDRVNKLSLPVVIPPNQPRPTSSSLYFHETPSSSLPLLKSPNRPSSTNRPQSPSCSHIRKKVVKPWVTEYPSTEVQMARRIKELKTSIEIRIETRQQIEETIRLKKTKINELHGAIVLETETLDATLKSSRSYFEAHHKLEQLTMDIEVLEEEIRATKSSLSRCCLEIRREQCLLDSFKSKLELVMGDARTQIKRTKKRKKKKKHFSTVNISERAFQATSNVESGSESNENIPERQNQGQFEQAQAASGTDNLQGAP